MTATVVPVPSLVRLLWDGVCDAAFTQVGAEAAGAVGLVGDDLLRAAAGSTQAEARDPDPFQERLGTDAVVALAGGQQDREWPAAAVAGEVDFGGQSASGPAKGVITRFVRPADPPFRPVAAAC